MERTRLVELDGLRGAAALLVVAFHYTTRYQAIYGHPASLWIDVPWGHLGVDLFFIISGFVIFLTLKRTFNAKDFVVSRFSRLFPGYWFAVICTYVVVTQFQLPGREVGLRDALVNFSMVQYWLGFPNVDNVYWTLTLELSFYAMMLGFYALRMLDRIEPLALLWLLCLAGIHLLEEVTGHDLPGIVRTTFLLDYGQLFIAGLMFYRLHETASSRMPRRTLPVHATLFLCLSIHGWLHGLGELMAVCGFFALFYAVIYGNALVRWLLTQPLAVYFGTISYSLYLVHQNIGYVVLRESYAASFRPLGAISAAVAVSLALATLITFLIERPAMTGIRTAWRALSGAPRVGRTL